MGNPSNHKKKERKVSSNFLGDIHGDFMVLLLSSSSIFQMCCFLKFVACFPTFYYEMFSHTQFEFSNIQSWRAFLNEICRPKAVSALSQIRLSIHFYCMISLNSVGFVGMVNFFSSFSFLFFFLFVCVLCVYMCVPSPHPREVNGHLGIPSIP
jgi:hypothetical protein